MRQLTIRGLGKELEQSIRRLAQEEDISLNKAAVRLLRRGAGLDQNSSAFEASIGDSLDHLAGTWSDREASLMEQVEGDFETIDPDLWN